MSTFLWLTISKRTSWVFSVGLASTSFSILTTPGSSLIERSNSKNESEDSWLGTTSVDIRILKRLSFSLTLSVGFRLDISCCRRFLSPRAVMPSSFRSSLSKSFRTAIVILFLENTAITGSSNWFLLNCSETSVYIPLTVWHFVSSHWQVWTVKYWIVNNVKRVLFQCNVRMRTCSLSCSSILSVVARQEALPPFVAFMRHRFNFFSVTSDTSMLAKIIFSNSER